MTKKNGKQNDTFRIDEIREMFDNEWVLIEVTKLRGPGQPSRGRVLAHHKSRMKIARMTRKFHEAHPGKMSYTLFSGDVIPKGVVVVLAGLQSHEENRDPISAIPTAQVHLGCTPKKRARMREIRLDRRGNRPHHRMSTFFRGGILWIPCSTAGLMN